MRIKLYFFQSIKCNFSSYCRLAAHGSDMLLIFNMFPEYTEAGIMMNEDDIKVSRQLIRLLIDFGKSGRGEDVMPGWEKFKEEDPIYLQIDKEFIIKQGEPMQERMQFWRSLPPVYWRYKNKNKNLYKTDEL